MTAPHFLVSNGEVNNPTQPTGRREAELEGNARSALERKAQRALSDEEWVRMRGKLIDFYALLSHWEKRATNGHPNIG